MSKIHKEIEVFSRQGDLRGGRSAECSSPIWKRFCFNLISLKIRTLMFRIQSWVRMVESRTSLSAHRRSMAYGSFRKLSIVSVMHFSALIFRIFTFPNGTRKRCFRPSLIDFWIENLFFANALLFVCLCIGFFWYRGRFRWFHRTERISTRDWSALCSICVRRFLVLHLVTWRFAIRWMGGCDERHKCLEVKCNKAQTLSHKRRSFSVASDRERMVRKPFALLLLPAPLLRKFLGCLNRGVYRLLHECGQIHTGGRGEDQAVAHDGWCYGRRLWPIKHQ
jgi:hypothetical protein